MKVTKYIFELTDPTKPKDDKLSLYLDECITDTDAITEADAQLDIMSSIGGIPHDEQWAEIKGTLLKDGIKIWSDAIVMEC